MSDDYELEEDEKEHKSNDELFSKNQEWSDIPLNSVSKSNSMNSCASHNSEGNVTKPDTRLKNEPKEEEEKKYGLSDWISKSSFRRQSLEDVFAQSNIFGKFGRERRNSETSIETCSSSSSAANKREFFLFGRQDDLTDSQIENFFLSPDTL